MSTLRQIRRLPNMRDVDATRIQRVEEAARRCMETLSLRGYSRIETPMFEETELFLRKSGGELSSRLYDFEEPGGLRTSIRPEYTSPVIRHAIESGEAESGTCRYQYFGPVFRYATPEHSDGGKTRQFNQLGAELIGSASPRADGEVIAMAVEGLAALSLPPVTIALAHVGLLRQLLRKFELSERSAQFLLGNASAIAEGQLEQVSDDAERLGLLGNDERFNAASPDSVEQIEQVLERSMGPLGANAGSRTRAEVIARLARKLTYSDDPQRFRSALTMFSELMKISGPPNDALSEGRKLATDSGLDEKCFMLLDQVVSAAVDEGVSESAISIRYGLARGFTYYTGMLFDILDSEDADDSLGGGGRYDGLTKALGLGADVPALGFAYNFDAVADLLPVETVENGSPGTVLVRPADDNAWQAAAQAAKALRADGRTAVLDTGESGNGDFKQVIVVDAAGKQSIAADGQASAGSEGQ